MAGDGVSLRSAHHPRRSWWEVLVSWWFPVDLNPNALEQVEIELSDWIVLHRMREADFKTLDHSLYGHPTDYRQYGDSVIQLWPLMDGEYAIAVRRVR
jgi:hypothetical protein